MNTVICKQVSRQEESKAEKIGCGVPLSVIRVRRPNIGEHERAKCPNCGALLVARDGLDSLRYQLAPAAKWGT